MKREWESVSDLSDLVVGNVVTCDSKPLAVIVEDDEDGRFKLALLIDNGRNRNLVCKVVDFTGRLKTIRKIVYSQIVSYTDVDVAERAKSLLEEFNAPERHSSLRDYYTFFNNPGHFAAWCQTGLYTEGAWFTQYEFTLIHSVKSLREGDHIAYRIGLGSFAHGILVKKSPSIDDMHTVEIVQFSGNINDAPKVLTVDIQAQIRNGNLYRYDYDIAVGVVASMAVTRAYREVEKVRANVAGYRTREQFAVWCKTKTTFTSNYLSYLAHRRILGLVHSPIQSASKLEIGQHIRFTTGRIFTDRQDAIVVDVGDLEIDIVYYPADVKPSPELRIARKTVDVSEYLEKRQLERYFYDVNEWDDQEAVKERAVNSVGNAVWETPFKNPVHFAIWCKTGRYQLHNVEVAKPSGAVALAPRPWLHQLWVLWRQGGSALSQLLGRLNPFS